MSDRGMSGAVNAAIQEPLVRPILLFDGAFKTGSLRLWTGIGPLDWAGDTYTGAGDLLSIGASEETDEVKAAGLEVRLAGVKPGSIAHALAEVERNRRGAIYFGLLDELGAIIPDPWPWFRGLLDSCAIDDGEETATIVLSYEHELIDLERPRDSRWTHEEQQRLFPNDTGLRYIKELQDKVLRWGSGAWHFP